MPVLDILSSLCLSPRMERILGLPAPLSTPRMCVCLESLDRILTTSVSQKAGMMLPEQSYYPFIRGHEFLEKSLSQCFIFGRPRPRGCKIHVTRMLARMPWPGGPAVPRRLVPWWPESEPDSQPPVSGTGGEPRAAQRDRPWTLKKNQYSSRS